jgi:hypothetical protein
MPSAANQASACSRKCTALHAESSSSNSAKAVREQSLIATCRHSQPRPLGDRRRAARAPCDGLRGRCARCAPASWCRDAGAPPAQRARSARSRAVASAAISARGPSGASTASFCVIATQPLPRALRADAKCGRRGHNRPAISQYPFDETHSPREPQPCILVTVHSVL